MNDSSERSSTKELRANGPSKVILASSVYCIDPSGEQVLLLKRSKEPFLGYWVAPGGKIQIGETPHMAALRELFEETNLKGEEIHLRGIVTETSPRLDWQWQIFLFVVTRFTGVLATICNEGELAWWRMDEVLSLNIPAADRHFFLPVLNFASPVYQALFEYDAMLNLRRVVEHGLK